MANLSTLTPEEIDRLARRRANAKMRWYWHATVFVLVNLMVFAKSKYGFGSHSWSPIPFLGWGLGLVLHGISVWLLGAGGSLRENMVQKERERLQHQQDQRTGL